MNCLNCNAPLTGRQRKYCCTKCKQKYSGNTWKRQNEKATVRKKEFVELKGGCCQSCGYSKCMSALHFHHRDPAQKEFKLDARNLANRSIESITAELEKCDLLCANCHAEVHEQMNLEAGLGVKPST